MLLLQNRDSLFAKPKHKTEKRLEGIKIFKTETHYEMRS